MSQLIISEAPDCEGQVAPYTFAGAASALDYIAGRHSLALRDEDARREPPMLPMLPVLTDMHLHRESHYRQSHSDASALLATREV
jgi:hypothetical protein